MLLEDRTIEEFVKPICRAVKAAGGRALLVGGLVRDCLIAKLLSISNLLQKVRDLDLEVYGIETERLRTIVAAFGRVNEVGESFSVYKLSIRRNSARLEIDVSLPRSESKVGRGHRGFKIQGDPYMSYQQAARRRDFTINAILYDPLTDELIDPYDGIGDIRRRLIRMVDAQTFVDDSLRVLRAMVFAARFEFAIDPETAALCRRIPLDDLPHERIWMEFEKLFLRAQKPSVGLRVALQLAVVNKLFPELAILSEGAFWELTLNALDVAARLTENLSRARRLTVMLAVLCLYLAEEANDVTASVLGLLDKFNLHRIGGYRVRQQVCRLVTNRYKVVQLAKGSDGEYRRLARLCDLELLYLVAKAESLAACGEASAQEAFWERVKALGLEAGAPRPILLGRHLLELGLKPGRKVGEIASAVYEMQLDGQISTFEEAVDAASRMLKG
ncbi:MAG: hypothetical protein RMM17_04835 [Acidobacteriota bacterium]|nr:hypothetical protein [Blastocatellia bacterium]MDW8411989.1 hypothetical protein [Acidobacteriota bacterium]